MTRAEGELVQPLPWRETVYVCDRCKAHAPRGVWLNDPEGDTTIECRTGGVAYPECDTRTKYRLDLCPKCFVEWLIPLVEAQGVDFESESAEP